MTPRRPHRTQECHDIRQVATAGLPAVEHRPAVAGCTAGQASSGTHMSRVRGSTRLLWLTAGLLLLVGCRPVAKADDPAADDEAVAPVKVEVRPIVRAALDETIEVLGTTQPLRSKTA